MAEAAAALYAVETVAEGAAVGALAVSKSTTPLHLRFRKLTIPTFALSNKDSVATTLNVVKGRAYLFGGHTQEGGSTSMTVITLPSDIENGEPDFQNIAPNFESERPLQQYASISSNEPDQEGFENVALRKNLDESYANLQALTRSQHVSTSIDSTIYVLAGTRPGIAEEDPQTATSETSSLHSCVSILAYSTQTNKWSVIHTDQTKCKDGIPVPRTGASCASTSHPQPDSAVEVTTQSHGTIFLHGGYDAQGISLRDMWAFDVSSKVWSRWPDLPDPMAEEVAGEGRITCVGKTLWRAGDGFGKMMYIDFEVKQGNVVSETSGPHRREIGVAPEVMKWNVLSFDEKAAHTALLGEIGAGSEKPLVNKTEDLPVPRKGAGLVPVKVGAGRMFLLYFMGEDGPGSVLHDVWSFQISAEEKSLAAMKDAVRSIIGKETGLNQWARCLVVESSKEDGQLELPQGLAHFTTDSWKDLGGGNVVLWGGVDSSNQRNSQCWIMSVE